MKTSQDQKPIKDLVELFKSQMMIANPEYQRGVVWNEAQQKRLIDSLFRGFTLPLIYLHEKKEEIGGFTREGLEIIDGQQRLIPSSIEGDSFRGFPNGKKSESMRRTDTEVRYGQSGCVTGRF